MSNSKIVLSNYAQLVTTPNQLRRASSLSFREPAAESYAFEQPFNQLSVFARSYETSEALKGLPLYAIASIGDIDAAPTPVAPTQEDPSARLLPVPLVHRPLGQLSTDHVGYASFDLGVLRSEETVGALRRESILRPGHHSRIGLRHLWVFPFADPLLVVDALRSGDIGPDFVALRLELDVARLANRVFGHPLASMQNPGISDWRLSPGSFSLGGALIVGADGCESLLPTNLATQRFRFSQIARVPTTVWERRVDDRVEVSALGVYAGAPSIRKERYRLGRMLEYTTEWFPIGHSLGPIAYSLPLAPGEIVNIAVVDWSRTDEGTRDETTGVSEALEHDQLRDRSLTETVDAVLQEWQHGSTVTKAGSAGFGLSAGPISIGATGSVGSTSSSSSGLRDLSTSTSQRIADSFHQATSGLRELRSTIVVQTKQSEKSNVQTRVVANYNHSHAMTIVYYEVLRHYRVVTQLARNQAAILVDFSAWRFDFKNEARVLAYRRELEMLLLDPRLASSFDALSSVVAGRSRHTASSASKNTTSKDELWFDRMKITITTGSEGTKGNPYVNIRTMDGQDIVTYQTEPGESGNARHLGRPNIDDSTSPWSPTSSAFGSGSVDPFEIRPSQPLQWKAIRGFTIGLSKGTSSFDGIGPNLWRIEHILLEAFTASGERVLLFDGGYGQDLAVDSVTNELVVKRVAPAPPPPKMEAFLDQKDVASVGLLLSHLEAHQHYYDRGLWLMEDPNRRASRFESMKLGPFYLMDIIDNRAIEVTGDWVAFPLLSDFESDVNGVFEYKPVESTNPLDAYVEQLLSLPSRGVFSEAKLGHCNASEVIDETRFWDWQKSPIPHHPPAIAAVSADSRARDVPGLAPTNLPGSIVNVVTPGSLPDPTGMSAALSTLSSSNVFRDMSGSSSLNSLLAGLSTNASMLAAEGIKNSNRQELLREIRAADELNADKKSSLVDGILTGEASRVGSAAAGTPSVSSPGSGNSSAPQATGGGGSAVPNSSTPGGLSADPPKEANVAGGGTTVTPTPSQPKAKTSTKPRLPAPMPALPGLQFQFDFQRAQGAGLATGRGNVRVRATGSGIGALPGGGGYVPGVTFGPPTAIQAKSEPEVFLDVPFAMGSIVVSSGHTGAPGQIVLEAFYEMQLVDEADLVAGVFVTKSTSFNQNMADRTMRLNGSTSYHAPASGNVAVFRVQPKVLTASITFESSVELQQQIASKLEASGAILTAEVSASIAESSAASVSYTMTMVYLPGGLDIVQTL